jgi:hypothetical protein
MLSIYQARPQRHSVRMPSYSWSYTNMAHEDLELAARNANEH